MRMASLKVVCSCLSILLAFCFAPQAGAQGSLLVETLPIELSGKTRNVDVYRDANATPAGVAVIAHGFTRSRARHRDLGRALAAAGVVAVIPDLPYIVNLWGNGDAVAELVRKLEEGALGMASVDRAQVVLIGTSAGGLATVLAGAQLPGIAGWIGLDPVDRTGTGAHAATQFTSPAIVLMAEPTGCNLFGSGRRIARSVPGLLRTSIIHGASHCDFESPTNNMCRAMCGPSSSDMEAVVRNETVMSALELLGMMESPGIPGYSVPEGVTGPGSDVE